MADDGKSHRIHVTVALIGLVGVLGTALVANWGTLFPPRIEHEESTAFTFSDAQRQAEEITRRWFKAYQSADIDTLVRLSPPPFYNNDTILTTVADVRERYQALATKGVMKELTKDLSILHIESRSVGDQKNFVSVNDKRLSEMEVSDDDLVVLMSLSIEGREQEATAIYFRRLSDRVEMAGVP